MTKHIQVTVENDERMDEVYAGLQQLADNLNRDMRLPAGEQWVLDGNTLKWDKIGLGIEGYDFVEVFDPNGEFLEQFRLDLDKKDYRRLVNYLTRAAELWR